MHRAGVVPNQCIIGSPSALVNKLRLGGPVKKKGKHRGTGLRPAGLILRNELLKSWREFVLIKVFTGIDRCKHDGVREVTVTENDRQ